MLKQNRSAELLQTIADALGTDVRTILALRDVHRLDPECDETAVLLKVLRLWRALPDAESRSQALQYLQALASEPLRAD